MKSQHLNNANWNQHSWAVSAVSRPSNVSSINRSIDRASFKSVDILKFDYKNLWRQSFWLQLIINNMTWHQEVILISFDIESYAIIQIILFDISYFISCFQLFALSFDANCLPLWCETTEHDIPKRLSICLNTHINLIMIKIANWSKT